MEEVWVKNAQEFIVGVKGVITQNSKVLLVHKQKDGQDYWDFPGGLIDTGEGIIQTLTRELTEELQLEPYEYTVQHVLNNYIPFPEKPLLLICYGIELHITNFTPTLSNEHTEYAWMNVPQVVSIIPKLKGKENCFKTIQKALLP